MKRNSLVLTILLALTILISSCAKDTGTVTDSSNENGAQTTVEQIASSTMIEPCQLITRAEAEELIGEAVDEAEKSENEVVGNKLCFYESADEDSDRFLQISLTQNAFIPGDEMTAEFFYTSIEENFSDELTIVDGIGDEAFIATPGIHILKGEYYIVIGVGNSDDEKNREILKAAGEIAIGNLDRTGS